METRSTKTTKSKKNPRKNAQTIQYQETQINYLKDLQPKQKNSYTIKVKALRVWKTYYMDAPSKANEINEAIWGAPVPCYNINMILMDEEASSEQPLKEGAQLIISGFNCVQNTASLKLTEHEAKIYFTKNTSVTQSDDFKSLNDGFEFVSFESIINNRINKAKAFDVVGQIVSNQKLKQVTVDERPTSLIEYELQNTRLQSSISNDTYKKPQIKLKTTLEDKRNENVTTEHTKLQNKRDIQKMNRYNKNTIIILDDSEDEKEAKKNQKKRCKNTKYGEDDTHEEKGIQTLEIKNTPIE
ncbi:replication protein A 70 kDa DNA-binding subunit D, partial [Tanacetum coccineum]